MRNWQFRLRFGTQSFIFMRTQHFFKWVFTSDRNRLENGQPINRKESEAQSIR